MRVFIENEAGSSIKNEYDPRSLAHIGAAPVSLPYPYPYGFVIGTMAGDGDSVDCFVVTKANLSSGSTTECTAMALIEQVEDGDIDHKVIAVPATESGPLDDAVTAKVIAFVRGVFAHVPGKQMEVGRVLGARDAERYLEANRE